MKAASLTLFAPAILLAGVSLAAGQQRPPQPPPQPPPAAPAPPAPAALSVPNPLAGLRPGPADLYRSPDGSDRFQHLSQYPAPPVVIGPFFPGPIYPGQYYYPSPSEISIADTYRAAMADKYWQQQRQAARGALMLENVPGAAQVFVDGYYVGLAEEFGLSGRPIDLVAGAHRIELRAPGYETVVFSVRIEPNGLLRYRGDMQSIPNPGAAAAPAPRAAAAKSVYVIPNCYAGDKLPTSALPKGCDVKKLQTRK